MPPTKTDRGAVVLTFDPSTRRSNRSRTEMDRQVRAQLETDAQRLGIPVRSLESNESLQAHGDDISVIEAAYNQGSADGRQALIAVIRYYCDGYESGLQNGQNTFWQLTNDLQRERLGPIAIDRELAP